MNVFFDNCTSPVLADTIGGFLRHQRGHAVHIRGGAEDGLSLAANATDTEWMEALGRHARDWIVVTGDHRIHRNAAEREAFRRAGLKGLLLAPAYQRMPVHRQASALLWRWPELIDVLARFRPPTLIGVPEGKSAKLDPLQW